MVSPPGRLNYDRDLAKHFVRVDGWLPAVKHRAQRNGANTFRYLTFCAAEAIDVFLIEKEIPLSRDATTLRLSGVYFCERRLEDFPKIADLIGSQEQGFQGEFADIILFEDTEKTAGLDLGKLSEGPRDPTTRHLLQLKSDHDRLVSAFPFDVINLDVSGAMFPPTEPPVSQTLKSLRRVIELQDQKRAKGRQLREFTLMLTTKVAETALHVESLDSLQKVLEHNLQHPQYKDAFSAKYHAQSPADLRSSNFVEFFVAGITKFLISEAQMLGWDTEFRKVYVYSRSDPEGKEYHMLSTVSHLRRIRPSRSVLFADRGSYADRILERYLDEAVETLKYSPTKVDVEALSPTIREGLARHLSEIVSYREEVRKARRPSD
jgi:hypothetical protein